MASLDQALAEAAGVGTVLVLRPQSARSADEEIKRLLIDDPESAQLLAVCFSRSPATWYDEWCEVLGTAPDAAAVVTTPDLADADLGDRDVAVENVATPSNLTGIGVKATPYLTEWSDAVVVIDSLSVLLQYADPQILYRFLHVLTTRLQTADARGQFFLDPNLLDDQTVELLKTLFDAVIESDGTEDGWSVLLR